VRPTQEELLATLRTSLNDTLVPAIEDRWARYVATAMDLVLQHLALRVTGEAASLADDSADMVAVLAGVADRSATAGRAAEQAGDADCARAWETLATIATPTIRDNDTSLASLTRQHEELRAAVVGVLRWLDAADNVVDEAALTTLRDDLHHLIRRQTDRMTELVRPLFMAFGPVAS
jgi:hypothetical protein